MRTDNEYPIIEESQEAGWYAWMDALEANWLFHITASQAEYQEERKRLNGNSNVRYRTENGRVFPYSLVDVAKS